MKPTYITGHKHPDTDSIVSALAYTYLKNELNQKAIACRLGECNAETTYLLERFHTEPPLLLKDARNTLCDIDLEKPYSIDENASIFEAQEILSQKELHALAVTNQNQEVVGIVTMKDLSQIGMNDTALAIDLLKHTKVEAMAKTLQGKLVYSDEQTHISGKVSIIALSAHGLKNYDVKDRIVILGDDPQAQKQLIEMGAGMLILVWAEYVKEDVIELAKKYHCPIIISSHGSMNTSRYLYFSSPVSLLMCKDVVHFKADMLCEDAMNEMKKSRYRMYPVLDANNRLQGYVGRYHLINAEKKKLILVDHNEFSQSISGIEQAQILEVIDHHRIHGFSSLMPVYFRNETVGSTATIIAGLYKEKRVYLPENIAALLLGGILSDTLHFHSPTTTQHDIFTAGTLAEIAGVNVSQFAKEMFEASSHFENRDMEDILDQDLKSIEIEDEPLAITQVIVYNLSILENRKEEILPALEVLLKKRSEKTIVACFTGVEDNGSYFVCTGKRAKEIEALFPAFSFQEKILSRKLQIVPMLQKGLI
jgi:manganese-dependent inorganic pyrophosphatase